MNALKRILSTLAVVLLSACGGGGEDAGAPPFGSSGGGGGGGGVTTTPFFTTAPSNLTLAVGSSSGQFTISGGAPGYSVNTNNAAVATVAAAGSTFTIDGVAGGTATVSIKDSSGAEISVGVSVAASNVSLFTTAPSALTVAVGGSTTDYSISGGSPPYSVASSNTAVANVGVNGTRFVVTGVSGGKTLLSVKDSVGASLSIEATVGSATALFTTAPAQLSLPIGAARTYLIGGGAVPYSASSSNGTLATAAVQGSELTIVGVASGSSTIVVRDDTGASVSIGVIIGSSGTAPPLFTSAAADIVVAPGTTPTYSIGGGTGPYSATSSNTAVASASVSGATTLSIAGVAAGGAKVVVLDAVGARVEINAVVGSGSIVALYTTAPPSVTVGRGMSQTYTVGGGVGPYSASVSDVDVVTASMSGSTLTVNGVSGGQEQVAVFDSTGRSVSIFVSVPTATALYTTAPEAVVSPIGGTLTYAVGGGTGPYSATSGAPSVAAAAISGSTLTVNALSAGTTQLIVRDAAGTRVTIGVTVPTGTSLYSTAPDSVSVAIGSTSAYTVGGGTDPYVATSSNTGVAAVSQTGSTLSITGVAAGTAQVVVRDAVGARITLGVTVSSASALYTTAPDAVSVAIGSAIPYIVGGGSAPYGATSSNVGVAVVSLNANSLTITGMSAGTAQISLRDAAGARVAIDVTVPAGAALFTTATGSVSVGIASPVTYTVGGGSKPYVVTSSNTAIVTAALNGDLLTVSGIAPGSAQVVVRDAAGAVVSIAVTVPTGAALFTTAPSSVSVAIGSPSTYSLGGGTAPYVVTSSNTSVATVGLNGSSMTISGVAPGTAQVVVRDATGALVVIDVTSAAANALATSAPSAITVAPSTAATYQISGGVAPYFATSNNAAVVAAAVSGTTLTVTAVSPGSGAVVVRDSVGATISLAVTVSPVPAMYTSAPSRVSIADGVSSDYSIGGGTASYSATTSDARVATVAVTGSTLTITGAAVGTAQVLVQDAVGTVVTIEVDVGRAIPLFSSAPAEITLLPGATQSYSIGGGEMPYRVASSNVAAVTATVSGETLDLTGVAAGAASVVVSDALGATVTISTTVTPAAITPLAVSPLAATASVGDELNFTISGGGAPYAVTINNPSIADVTVSGSTFKTNLLNDGATTIAIIDSNGQVQTVSLTVTQEQPLLRLSPTSVAVSELATSDVVLDVFGGTAPYRVFTSDQILSSVTVSGSRVTVGLGTNGDRCIDSSMRGYVEQEKEYGDWTAKFGSLAVIITVLDDEGRSTNASLIIADSVGACP